MPDHDQENSELATRLVSEQNFMAAAIAGAVATVLSAIAYGIVVEKWPVTYGFSAAGVGIVVGFFIGFTGRGISMKFSVLAAVYTIAGCILGNLFVKIWEQVQASSSSIASVLQSSTLSSLAGSSISGLTPIHLVFWSVAVVAAVFLAKRSLSRSERLALRLYEANV